MDSTATTTVDLTDDGDAALCVDISDALSERDWVKFTVHTKTTMTEFSKTDFSVIRLHEEFLWLHDTLTENPDYAGSIIPPAPPRPDFDASREKLRKLGDAECKCNRVPLKGYILPNFQPPKNFLYFRLHMDKREIYCIFTTCSINIFKHLGSFAE